MRTLNLIFKGMTLVVFMLVNSSADASDMLSTQSTEDLLNQAVEQYDDALFGDAIESFQLVIGRMDSSASNQELGKVLYNLGNSFYKNGNTAGALAAYLSARLRLPRDADLNANIAELKREIKDQINTDLPVNKLSSVFPFFEICTKFEIQLILASFMLIFAVFSLLTKNIELRKIGLFCLVASIILLPTSFVMSFLKSKNDNFYAVSAEDKLQIMSSPGKAGIPLFEVSMTTPLLVESDVGPYLKVILQSEAVQTKSGWVKKTDVFAF